MKNCLHCKTKFKPATKRSKFCSQDCSWRFRYSQNKPTRIKHCQCCGKQFTDNSKTNQRKYCDKECHLFYPYKVKYGLSKKDYQKLQSKYPKCAICGKRNKEIALAVDHCHKSGKVRGMLCTKCNRALGGFNDSVQTLKNAVEYLEKSKE